MKRKLENLLAYVTWFISQDKRLTFLQDHKPFHCLPDDLTDLCFKFSKRCGNRNLLLTYRD